MIQVVSGSTPATILPGVTSYTNLLGGLRQTLSTIPVGDVVPIACRVRNIFLRLSTAPGVGASRRFTIVVNDTDTAAAIVIADDETFGAFISPDLTLAVGDWVHLKCEEFGSPATSGFARFSYEIETTGSTQAVFFGNTASALNSYPVKYGGVVAQIAYWDRDIDGGPDTSINILPIDGTVTGYRIRLKRGLPASSLSGSFTIYKSTDSGATFVAQDGSGGTPDTRLTLVAAATFSQASASFSLSVSRGDLLYMKWQNVAAGGASWGCSMATLFTSSVANQWPYCGEPSGNIGTSPYNAIFAPRGFSWSSSESGRNASEGGYSDFSLAKFILYLHTPPGAGDTQTFTTRLNSVDQTLAVTLSDSDQVAEDIIHTVPIVFGDTFGMHHTLTGSPASTFVSWGFIQDTSGGGGGGEIPGDLPILGEIGPYMVHHWPREIP